MESVRIYMFCYVYPVGVVSAGIIVAYNLWNKWYVGEDYIYFNIIASVSITWSVFSLLEPFYKYVIKPALMEE